MCLTLLLRNDDDGEDEDGDDDDDDANPKRQTPCGSRRDEKERRGGTGRGRERRGEANGALCRVVDVEWAPEVRRARGRG